MRRINRRIQNNHTVRGHIKPLKSQDNFLYLKPLIMKKYKINYSITQKGIIVLFLFTLTLNLFGQKRDYNHAIKANSISEYKSFLNKNPKSKYAEDITKRLIELEYVSVNRWMDKPLPQEPQQQLEILKQAIYSYNRFLKDYPNSEYQKSIVNKTQEIRDKLPPLDAAVEEIKREEDRKRKEEEAIREAVISKLRQSPDLDRYIDFLTNNPTNAILNNEYMALVEERIDSFVGSGKERFNFSQFPFNLFMPDDFSQSWWGITNLDNNYKTVVAKSKSGEAIIINTSIQSYNINGAITEYKWYSVTGQTARNPLISVINSSINPGTKATFYSDSIKKMDFTILLKNKGLEKIETKGAGYVVLDQNGIMTVYKIR